MANVYELELKSYYDDFLEETAYPFLKRLSNNQFSKSDVFKIDKDVNAFFIQNDKYIKIPGPCEVKIGKIEGLEKPFFGKVNATVCCFEKYDGRVFEAVWDETSFIGDTDARAVTIKRKDLDRSDKFNVDYEFRIKYIVKDDMKVCKKLFNLVKSGGSSSRKEYIGDSYENSHFLDEYVALYMPSVFQNVLSQSEYLVKGRYLPENYSDEEKAELSRRFLKVMNANSSVYGLEFLIDESEFNLKTFERRRSATSKDSPTKLPLGTTSSTPGIAIRPGQCSRYIYQYEYTKFLPETEIALSNLGNWAFVKRNPYGHDELKSVYSPAGFEPGTKFDLVTAFNNGVLNPEDKIPSYNRSSFPYTVYYLPSRVFSKDVYEFKDIEFLRPDGSVGGKISFYVEFEYGDEKMEGLDVQKAMEFVLDNYDLEIARGMSSPVHPYPANVFVPYVEKGIRENLWAYYDSMTHKFVENNLYVKPKIVTSIIPSILEARIREQLHFREYYYELTGYKYHEDYYPELIIDRLEFYK